MTAIFNADEIINARSGGGGAAADGLRESRENMFFSEEAYIK
jgi:hypothetical protein